MNLKSSLIQWANTYETPAFIAADPISIPHRYTQQSDIEISAFVSAWLAYGNRKAIIEKANFIDREIFKGEPTSFIKSFNYNPKAPNPNLASETSNLYRFYTYSHWYKLCKRLNTIYTNYNNMEAALRENISDNELPFTCIQKLFDGINGIPLLSGTSACKRLCLFLRWMCRNNSPVDFGLWTIFSPSDLIIPLDTHVHSLSLELGLSQRKSADIKTALEITKALKEVFPGDPTLGDFALFGYDLARVKS